MCTRLHKRNQYTCVCVLVLCVCVCVCVWLRRIPESTVGLGVLGVDFDRLFAVRDGLLVLS